MSAGFEHAPITQMVAVAVTLFSTALRSNYVSLDLNGLLRGELWRIITCFLVFQNAAQTIVGLILLYTCRQFERQMGSKKFGAFLVVSFLLSMLVSIALTVVAASVGFYLVPSSGPFALIFALMVYYYWHIPKLHATQYSFAGLDLSEKSWIYLLAVQLMLSDGVPSVAAASAGLLAGYLYETDGYGLQSWRLPRPIERSFEIVGGFFHALLPQPTAGPARAPGTGAAARTPANTGTRHNLMMGDGSPRGMPGNNLFQDLQQFEQLNPHGDFSEGTALQRPAGRGMPRQAASPAVALPPPSEEAIEALMGMGFEREAVVEALRSTGNNVEAAANSLLR